MVENIKSIYFTKIIFNYVQEKTKLKIVKYNKTLQKSLNIGLVNYKVLSRRYIIFGENGKGREYNILDNSLIFEGEYKNGKRNGKGKEYYDYFAGKLKFEGEFLYNKKWNGKGYNENLNIIYELINGTGIVKEYDNGKLEFEGEYLNGKRNGKGKEYDWDGKLKFEGEYLNGKRNGKGKEYYDNVKLKFEGEYLYGKEWEKEMIIKKN